MTVLPYARSPSFPDRPGAAGPAAANVHLSGYQARDYEVVDYQMTELPGTGLMFRGPLPETLNERGSYFACIGAAQTLGCFCDKPFPTLVADQIGLPALNLGYGGAGPEFYLRQPALLPYLNRSRFVIMQVMSARSQSNPLYECGGLEYVTMRGDGRRLGAHAAFDEMVHGPDLIWRLPLPFRLKRKLGNWAALPRAKAFVDAVRDAWERSSLELLEKIEVPVILCWVSKRTPEYRQRYGTGTILGEFPHLITPEMVARLEPYVAGYVESVSSRGSPQPLYSRFTGAPVTVSPSNDRPDLGTEIWDTNFYYPSPEMHEDTADQVLTFLREVPTILAGR